MNVELENPLWRIKKDFSDYSYQPQFATTKHRKLLFLVLLIGLTCFSFTLIIIHTLSIFIISQLSIYRFAIIFLKYVSTSICGIWTQTVIERAIHLESLAGQMSVRY